MAGCFRAATLGMLVLLAGAGGGCEKSPWQREFVPSDESVSLAPGGGPIRTREVPWERVQETLADLHAEWVASDLPREEWPESRKLDRRARLLRGLQVTADPRSVDVLGRSEFRSTDRLRPYDGELEEFARKIGANTVVWSSTYLGKTDVVRSEPVTEYRTGSFDRRGEDGRSRTFSESSTIYVPVVLKADERAWIAYFLREHGDGPGGDAAGRP